MNKTLIGVVSAVTALSVFASTTVSYADKLSDKKQQLEQQQQTTKAAIVALQAQEKGLSEQVSKLSDAKSGWEKTVADAQAQLIQKEQEISLLESQIDDLQRKIDAQYKILSANEKQIQDMTHGLGFLMSVAGFSSFSTVIPSSTMSASQHKQTLLAIQDDKNRLTSMKAKLESEQKTQQDLVDVLNNQRIQAENNQNGTMLMIKQTKEQMKQEEKQLSSESYAMNQLQHQIELLGSDASFNGPSAGWVWPVPSCHSISSGYGWRTWSDGTKEFHNGIDIPGALGAPIVSATNGKVLLAGPAQGFGDWIVIESSNGLLEIYGHMYSYEIKVSPGQIVHAGQQIAAVGSNGESTGPHLHFTIATGFNANGGANSVNPLRYVSP